MEIPTIVIEVDGKRICWAEDGYTDLNAMAAPYGKKASDYLDDPQVRDYLEAWSEKEASPAIRCFYDERQFNEEFDVEPQAAVMCWPGQIWGLPEICLHFSGWIDPAFQIAYYEIFRKAVPNWLELFMASAGAKATTEPGDQTPTRQ